MSALRDDLAGAEAAVLARFAKAVWQVVLQIRAAIQTAVDQVEVDEGGKIIGGSRARLEVLAELEADWSGILAEAGYPDAVEELSASFEEVISKLGLALGEETGVREQMISAAEGSARDLLDQLVADLDAIGGEDGPDALHSAVLSIQAGPIGREDLVAKLSGAVGTTFARANSLADTTAMGIDRAMTLALADAGGFEWALYDGPDDVHAREFCAARVGMVFRRDEIDDEDNDVGPQPPSRYGGGYNCRHRWVPLTFEDAQKYPRWGGGE